jgi:type I restriction enzyme M protein
VERPLRLNFQAASDRIARVSSQKAFLALSESKKRKDKRDASREIEQGTKLQAAIISSLQKLDGERIFRNRDAFKKVLDSALADSDLELAKPVYNAILSALSERDPKADICFDAKGNPEADPDLRDIENASLPRIKLPLPVEYKSAGGKEPDNEQLVNLVKAHCDAHFEKEIKPNWPDAWIDYSKTKVGYEIPITREFYSFDEPRPIKDVVKEIGDLESKIIELLKDVA